MRPIDADSFLDRVLPECKYPEALKEAVDAEPTLDVQPSSWIPTHTALLPKVTALTTSKQVLYLVKTGDVVFPHIGRYNHKTEKWLDSRTNGDFYARDVVAWCPIPKF